MQDRSPESSIKRICFPFIGRTVGGAHISHLLIAAHLDPARYEGVFALHDAAGLMRRHMEQRNLPFHLLPGRAVPGSARDFLPHRWGTLVGIVGDMRAFLKEQKIDLIQVPDGIERILWQLAAALSGVPCLLAQRTPVANRYSPEKMLSYALMDAIACNSQTTKASLPVTATRRSYVVYPALDLSCPPPDRKKARQKWAQRLGLADEAAARVKIVGFLGNFAARKRPLFFIELAARLMAADNGATPLYFVMAGSDYGAFAGRMREAALRADFGDRLKICDFVQEPLDFLAACDVFVAPARNEAFGRTLIEAMYAGTPVVASDEAGHKEIVRDKDIGFLLPPEDGEAFCRAIRHLLEDGEAAAQMARAARAYVLRDFSQKTQAGKFMEIYDAVLAGK